MKFLVLRTLHETVANYEAGKLNATQVTDVMVRIVKAIKKYQTERGLPTG
jgi:hypothetical protein